MGGGEIIINNNDKFTLGASVFLHLKPDTSSTVLEYALFENEDCSGPQQWNKFTDSVPYKFLNTTDGTKSVYVIYKYKYIKEASGYKLGTCVKDEIILDTKKPVVQISGPPPLSNSKNASLQINASDENGISQLKCKLDNSPDFISCANAVQFTNLAEGEHNLYARAKDNAGNESETVQYSWKVDTVPPILTMISSPANLTTNASADFKFSSVDPSPGSGVYKHICQLDSNAIEDCSRLTFTSSKLSASSHTFKVYSVDYAGNVSISVPYTWTISTPINLGDFSIQGVAPLNTTAVNGYWLIGSLQPRLYHSSSTNALSYTYRILNSNNVQVCSGSTNQANPQFIDLANCTLQDTLIYTVYVKAAGKNLDGTVAVPLEKSAQFQVDYSLPLAVASSVTTPQAPPFGDNIILSYRASDVSGIKSITCFIKSASGQISQYNCSGATQKQISGLIAGNYQFNIQAVDNNNQVNTSNTLNFTVQPNCALDEKWMNNKCQKIICDAFSVLSSNGTCDITNGLLGNLYYFNLIYNTDGSVLNPLAQQKVDYVVTSFNGGLTSSTKSSSLIFLSSINVATRDFNDGFIVGTDYLRTPDGNKVVEYFGLDLFSGLKVNTDSEVGYYQFFTQSDDGSLFDVANNQIYEASKNPKTSYTFQNFIDNDGVHPAQIRCSTTTLYVQKNSAIPIRLKYYQGPRYQISFSLYWKKVASPSNLESCEDNLSNMVNKGFSLIKKENFIAPKAVD